jgi:alkanesulfonate monooxygenase SsuD/methylene tetrahydromethanopterin reductase-like flavin-dependent oxidoreductase (luciferase family)
MAQGTIGVQVAAMDAPGLLKQIENAERLGIEAVWATSDPVDSLTVMAAAAVRTERVLLGTAITRAVTRHPLAMAQHAAVVAQLSSGRFRLGLGPVHRGQVGAYGPVPQRALAHFGSYLRTVKQLLSGVPVDVDENGVVAHGRLVSPPSAAVPVMASALQAGSFRLCGEVADGAITWICPADYVREVALPALRDGAAEARRDPPPLILHVPVFLSTDEAAVRRRMGEHFAFYLRNANYLNMLAEAGFPEAAEPRWSDAMVDAVAVYGSETAVGDRLRELVQSGADELLVTAMSAGEDAAAESQRVLAFLGGLGRL